MPEEPTFEDRLNAVEQELSDLKQRLPDLPHKTSWVERIAGTFQDDNEFDEIVRLGRDFRKSAD